MFLNHHVPPPGKQSIISLVPSLTELLFDLGLGDDVTGITKFCVHPNEWFRSKIKIGGTKTIDVEKVKSLRPSLIIANKEENVQSQVEALSDFPVWLTDVNNFEDALQMIRDIGHITGRSEKADKLVGDIKESFSVIKTNSNPAQVVYLIWKDPYMTIGGDTFISDMLTRTGMRNVFENRSRYPEVSIDEIRNSGCDLLLLSSEPYPFKQKHADELTQLLPKIKIKIVDGEMFSWYGSRLLKAAAYLKNLQAGFLSPA